MNTITPIADPWRMQIVMLPIRHITADEARDDRIAAVRRATGQRRSDSTRQRILDALDDGELSTVEIGRRIGYAMGGGLEVLEREHAESFERWHNERRKREKLVSEVVRCYQMLLSEPNTKDALFNAENILREALAEQKVGDGRAAT